MDDYSSKLEEIKASSDSANVDTLLAEFESGHDSEVKELLIADGFDLSTKASARRDTIIAEQRASQKRNCFW